MSRLSCPFWKKSGWTLKKLSQKCRKIQTFSQSTAPSSLLILSDRLSHFDRGTLVSLLSQREDISEEEANRIVDNIESVRHQFVEQAQAVQRQMQSVIDGVFSKIRNYLNSLDRPELNYEGIKWDFRKVFDDPELLFNSQIIHTSSVLFYL